MSAAVAAHQVGVGVQAMMAEVDTDGSGEVGYPEFLQMMGKT